MRTVEKKICEICGKTFKGRTTQKYCSKRCRKKAEAGHVIVHPEPPAEVPIIREFRCKECGRVVLVWQLEDNRTVFCSYECQVKYWKHHYLKDQKHHTSGNNITGGMSLGSLIRREKMDEA